MRTGTRVEVMRDYSVPAALLAAALLLGALAVSASGAEVTDRRIADAVEDELLFDTAVRANDITVTVVEGVVTLDGEVSNALARDRAVMIAETVRGVRSVVDLIEVDPYWGLTDAEIEQKARDALLYNPAAESYEIGVDVDGKVATLTGKVESWAERDLAGKVVKGVRGVRSIENDIVVEYVTERSDMEIENDVEERLRWDVLVDDGLIEVSVDGGEVSLEGTVGSLAEKRQARNDAWVAGVEEVDVSGLEVKMWARDERLRKDKYVVKPARRVKEAIEDALLYDPRVLSMDVTPEVTGGVVTLRGAVGSLEEKRAAGDVARNTVGVVTVDNRIRIRPVVPVDEDTAEEIRNALERDPWVEKNDISVSVIDDTAYLSGAADTYFEKGRADDIASEADGVTEVRNNIVVDYPDYPLAYDPYLYDYYFYDYDWYDYEPYYTFSVDWEIEEDIESELFWSPFVDEEDVDVTVESGVATLTGVVDTWAEYNAAEENAYEGGATWVENDLAVK